MKKKDYQKPTMNVVECEQETELLAASVIESMRSGYGEAQEEEWDDEEE